MKASVLNALEGLVPPKVWQLARSRFGNRFEGNFANWEDAERHSSGYAQNDIVSRIAEAVREVEAGRAAAERDGVLLSEVDYGWPALACLLLIANLRGGSLNVVDFGGSLGRSYRQNRKFLQHVREVRWGVVEQASFVEQGKLEFENETLRFFLDLDEAIRTLQADVVLLSAVVHYLPKPQAFLDELLQKGVEFLLFDRTPFISGERDRLTVQRVPAHIYPASYPAWFFSRERFFAKLQERYVLVESFAAPDRATIDAEYIGCLWRRK
jgi:putative methyltransferase (TIGR04325 family)